MSKHKYRPIEDAPKDGTPVIGLVGGVEAAVCYDDGPVFQGWFYWDEDETAISFQVCKPQPDRWRALF